jgi:hypothetical protein
MFRATSCSVAKRGEEGHRDHRQAELVVAVERERRDHRHQQAAERAAASHRQVERRQVARGWPQAIQLAVAEQAGDEESREEDAELHQQVELVVGVHEQPRHAHEPHQAEAPEDLRAVKAPLEGEDEGDEVERERRKPQQRDRRDVLREVVGHRQQHRRACRRQREPVQVIAAGGRQGIRDRSRRRAALAAAAPGQPRTAQREQRKQPRPSRHLLAVGEPRLNEQRIADERDERSDVREGEQAIRIRPGALAREPRLHQRAGGRQQQVRQPHRHREQQQDRGDRLVVALRLPRLRGRDRQRGRGGGEQRDVQDRLRPWREPRVGPMRVGVAREQQRLEEQHAGRPHRRAAAEPRQDQARDERLHQEQQERRQRDDRGVQHPAQKPL